MKLDRTEFTEWLALQPAERVFTPGACHCPLASFLSAKNDNALFQVTTTLFANILSQASREWQSWQSLPDWAREFVFRFDKQVAYSALEDRNVKVARAVMAGIPLNPGV